MSQPIFGTERKRLLDNVRKIVRSLDLQSYVSIRLCMLVHLRNSATELDRMLSPDELDLLHTKISENDLESLISAIDSEIKPF